MDDQGTIIEDGVVYTSSGRIRAVEPAATATPPGFEQVPVKRTRGSIFPGLIELHNHLSYNVLRLWQVPERYHNRDTWAGIPAYRQLISGPMGILGRTPRLVPALVRYVECKCLLGGVTTSQGIALYSDAGIRHFYKGLVRNVEQTGDPALPQAQARIPDVSASSQQAFWAEVSRANTLILHLSEGTDPRARQHFFDLQLKTVAPKVAKKLVGIHCVALEQEDIDVLAEKGCAMVWSPFSNLLLYGETAKIRELKAAGVRIGLGSDWSPSGSKNLLGELKVARLYSDNDAAGPIFTTRELVSLATRNPAEILGWEAELGTIEVGKRADLVVVDTVTSDPYAALLEASERHLALVVIEGVPRFGSVALMPRTASSEETSVAGRKRLLDLSDPDCDPDVSKLSLATASAALSEALANLPALAAEPPSEALVGAGPGPHQTWMLALDEVEDTNYLMRLPLPGEPPHPIEQSAAPLELLPLELDPLTAVDDAKFLTTVADEENLPAHLASGLAAYYQ
jgi:hypothetical protein